METLNAFDGLDWEQEYRRDHRSEGARSRWLQGSFVMKPVFNARRHWSIAGGQVRMEKGTMIRGDREPVGRQTIST